MPFFMLANINPIEQFLDFKFIPRNLMPFVSGDNIVKE